MMHSTFLACLLGLAFFNFGHARRDCILVVGGGRSERTSTYMEYFCPWAEDKNCELWTRTLAPRVDHVAGMLDGDVILAGGRNGTSTETFNLATWEQTKQGDMLGAFPTLANAGGAVINDSFYVCGGGPADSSSDEVSNVCMAYKSGEWAKVEPMKYARKGHGFVAVDNLHLYAFGGDGEREPDSPHNPVLSSMERFDPRTEKWVEKARMLTPRRNFASAVYEYEYYSASIYACGGTDWDQSFSSCERYSPELNRWDYLANMTNQKQQFTLIQSKWVLYAMGGYIGDEPGELGSQSVDGYVPRKHSTHGNTWFFLSNLIWPRAGHSATSVQLNYYDDICSRPIITTTTTTTTAKPDSASQHSPINIIGLLFLGFWASLLS